MMDSERFMHLQGMIGYDNEQMAGMFKIDVRVVEDYRSGRTQVPAKQAAELELFVDWAMEVGDTTVKRGLAKKYLGG